MSKECARCGKAECSGRVYRAEWKDRGEPKSVEMCESEARKAAMYTAPDRMWLMVYEHRVFVAYAELKLVE